MAGGDGMGGGGVSSTGICPVCGFNQPNLTQHLSRHSKEEIIRAVTYGHPLPELANRRPPGRPRRPSYPAPAVASVAPISPRPTTSQTPLLITQSQSNDQTLGAPLGPMPPSTSGSHQAPVQTLAVLIGNNMFPAGGVIPNNLPLGNNGVSYLIPSSGGLMLAAAPPTNQTLLVQTPTSAAAQTLPVKHQPPTSMSIAEPGTILAGPYTSSLSRRPPRPLLPESVCILDEPYTPQLQDIPPLENYRPETSSSQIVANTDSTIFQSKDEPVVLSDNQKATIHIGRNISISLPKDLVSKKERLKEIINQELVRALLMNDSNESQNMESQPSTSTAQRKMSDLVTAKVEVIDDSPMTGNLIRPSVVENVVEENHTRVEPTYEGTVDSDHDGELHRFPETELKQDVDPLSDLVVPSSSRSRSSSNIHIDPNVPSPAHNITIENGMDDNFNHHEVVSYNIPVDEPMEVIFDDRCSNNRVTSGAANTAPNNNVSVSPRDKSSFERSNNHISLVASASVPEPDACNVSIRKSALRRNEIGNNNIGIDICNSPRLSAELIPVPQTSGALNQNRETGRSDEPDVLCCDDDQPLSFLASDRTLNTLLGESTLQEMVYVEEQVLGAVEEVFSGQTPSGIPGTSSASMNPSSSQKSLQRKVNTSYMTVYEDQQCTASTLNASEAEKKQDLKCKTEPQVGSSQPGSSVSRPDSYQVIQVPRNQNTNRPTGHIAGKVEAQTQEQEEELVDDPSLVEDFASDGIFPNDPMFERELSNHQAEEVMSLKASETLADSDSERATPHEELQDLMFYDRSCMFAGEPGPANLSPRTYPSIDTSTYHALTPALITHHLDHTVQIDSGQPNVLSGLVEGSTDEGVVELSPSETTMHLPPDDCCSVLPPDGISITQLFPSSHHDTSLSSPSVVASSAMSCNGIITSSQSKYDVVEDSKISSKMLVMSSSTTTTTVVSRQLSPIPSTSGLQDTLNTKKIVKEDEEYEFEYESDCYGDSDSDSGVTNRGPLDLDHWKCSVCNKLFKSLKEKLLHAGQHSPCAEAMGKSSAAIKKASLPQPTDGSCKKDEIDAGIAFLQCKEEMGMLQEQTRTMLESCASNGEYKCPECGIGYPSAETLLAHRKMVFKSRVTCQICHMVFKRRVFKLKHVKTHTLADLKCLICNRNFPNRYSWSQHQLFHMGLVMFECNECGKRFQRKSELEVHSRTHTGERPFPCVSCSSAFTTRQALKRHLVTHMDGQEVDCETCQKTYKNIVCLNKHKLKAHSKGKGKTKVRRDFMCNTCNEVFSSEKKLAWHQETHERWPKKCEQCGECFIHQSSLTKHIRFKHNPHHQTSDGKSENNSVCHVCCKVFKKSSLALHLRTHTGVKPFKCHICNRSFAVKCNLDAHKWVHMGVRDRPHKCKMCERSFHRKKDMEAHIRSHKNIRPFTCNECGKSFIHKNNLQLHVREHSGEKEHKCYICGKEFFRKYNLDNHVRIHTGEMPYECTICRKDFTQKSNYNVHMKAFHVERHAVHEEV